MRDATTPEPHDMLTSLESSGGASLGHNAWNAAMGGRHPLIEQIEQLRAERDELRLENEHLRRALENSRMIGTAVGIVMTQNGAPVDDAFEVLRSASQSRNTKIRELAEEVVYTGQLPDDRSHTATVTPDHPHGVNPSRVD